MKKDKMSADIKYGLRGRFVNMELDDWQRKANHWTVTLHYQGRRMTIPFFTGPLFEGDC